MLSGEMVVCILTRSRYRKPKLQIAKAPLESQAHGSTSVYRHSSFPLEYDHDCDYESIFVIEDPEASPHQKYIP